MNKYFMDIDKNNVGSKISDKLYGLFYEDISSAADGGLSPELIKNNSFENYFNVISIDEPKWGRGTQYSWQLHWQKSGCGDFTVISDANTSICPTNTNYARLSGDVTLVNTGFSPLDNPDEPSIAISCGSEYDFSVWTRCECGFVGSVRATVVDKCNKPITNEIRLDIINDGEGHKLSGVITGTADKKGSLVFSLFGADEKYPLDIDIVSLSPKDTYGYGDINYARGKGLRRDLVEALSALKPSFIRFPGGCIVEGSSGRDSYYNWENSIGPLEERRATTNLWVSNDNGKYDNISGYMQSFEFGYHEILKLCEDFGAEPFPILSAGVFCQFRNEDKAPAARGGELDKFARHITHLIDYCLGSTESKVPVQREWAKRRVDNGHPAVFNLNYVGIGNENWGEKYFRNFDYLKKYVENYVRNNYPNHPITIISSAGPDADRPDRYGYAWEQIFKNYPGETLVDEHYYKDDVFMLTHDTRYDYYTRLDSGGSNVFLGEYATKTVNRENSLYTALCDAAYLTGIERNADIVRHASYAPLFGKVGFTNWTPNLIQFDEYTVGFSPNYYTQKLFALNYGNTIIDTTLKTQDKAYGTLCGAPCLSGNAVFTHITVKREDGAVLLDGEFNDDMGWELCADGCFSIKDGALSIESGTVWLPKAVKNPEWQNYQVTVKAAAPKNGKSVCVGVGAFDRGNRYVFEVGETEACMYLVMDGIEERIGNMRGDTYEKITEDEIEVCVSYGIGKRLNADFKTESRKKRNCFSARIRPYQNDIYHVCSKDDKYIYLKLVNVENTAKPITLRFIGLYENKTEIICMSGEKDAVNLVGEEEQVHPISRSCRLIGDSLEYEILPMSLSVIKVEI